MAVAFTWDDALVRVLHGPEPAVTEPEDLESAVRQLNLLRERLSDANKTTSSVYAQLHKTQSESAVYKRGYESLRDLLGTFSPAGDGWHRSALVSDDDFRGWQDDAGL